MSNALAAAPPKPAATAHRPPRGGKPWFFLAAAALFAFSFDFAYWEIADGAGPDPQEVTAYLDHLETRAPAGCTAAADRATLERSTRIGALVVIGLLTLAAVLRSRWSALLALPALAFPWVVLADLHAWLQLDLCRDFRDKTSWPPLGLFELIGLNRSDPAMWSRPGPGFWIAALAILSVLAGLGGQLLGRKAG